MLNTLGFHLTVPTPYQFLSSLLQGGGARTSSSSCWRAFVVESSACRTTAMLKYPGVASRRRAAAYVAMKTLGKGEWNDVMEAHTRYTEAEIRPCANAMARLQRKSATASCPRCTKSTATRSSWRLLGFPPPLVWGRIKRLRERSRLKADDVRAIGGVVELGVTRSPGRREQAKRRGGGVC